MKYFAIIFVALLSPKSHSAEPIKFCVHVDRFDLNPNREIKDGKELAYLENLFPSLISTEKDEVGILSAFEFSPDGKTFRGKISKDIKWSNGNSVLPEEVVFSFIQTLAHRPLGSRVTIEGLNKLSTTEDLKSVSGFKLINKDTFELKFKSTIANITGVLREAMSTGSNQNRFWFQKKVNGKNIYISRYPIESITNTRVDVVVGKNQVAVVANPLCKLADMGIYPPALNANLDDYDKIPSPMKTAVTAVFNTKLSRAERIVIAQNIKIGFSDTDLPKQFQVVQSFYTKGDPGFSSNQPWKDFKVDAESKNKVYKIFYEVPIYKDIMMKACKQCLYVPTGNVEIKNSDVQLLSSTISGGRHIILQDLLQWEQISEFLRNAPKTKSVLKEIADKSASTIPPDDKTLQKFEITSHDEMSIMPVARRVLYAYTKKGTPLQLDFNSSGELIFKPNQFKNK